MRDRCRGVALFGGYHTAVLYRPLYQARASTTARGVTEGSCCPRAWLWSVDPHRACATANSCITAGYNQHHHHHHCFYARQHICYSAYMPRQFCLSVRLSVTHVLCVKTAKRIIEILSPSDRPIILVFRHQGSLRKSDGFTPNGGAKYRGGVAIFDQYAAISRKW